jgi:hypothetical protein
VCYLSLLSTLVVRRAALPTRRGREFRPIIHMGRSAKDGLAFLVQSIRDKFLNAGMGLFYCFLHLRLNLT